MVNLYIERYLSNKIEQEFLKIKNKQAKPSEKSLQKHRLKLEEEYEFNYWLKNVVESFSEMFKVGFSLATHIAKGIHSSSKSSNIIFKTNDTKQNIHLGSHQINSLMIDANNSNTAVYIKSLSNIISFLNIECYEARLYELIIENDPNIIQFFENWFNSGDYERLRNMLINIISNPKISGVDKQVLFPLSNSNYRCIFPSYPSSLAHELYLKINDIKFNEHNKLARKNRREKKEYVAYSDIIDLAFVKLGGNKPLNVSVFNKEQNGRNYLLPSLPPKFTAQKDIRISPTAQSIFDSKALQYKVKDRFNALFKLIKTNHNTVHIRRARSALLDDIIYQIFIVASHIQQHRPAGWSKDYELAMSQKYWLDPKRGELEGEEDFKAQREQSDWQEQIQIQFADWLQHIFKTEFKAIAHEFADPEHTVWRSEMEDAIKQSLRQGKELFA